MQFSIGRDTLTINELVSLADQGSIDLDESCSKRLEETRRKLVTAIRESDGRRMYGINTGFADNRVALLGIADQSALQENLIRSHASGFGPLIDPRVVRAAIVTRANSLALGHSGVRPMLIQRLCDLYNSGKTPQIPTYGSVGASGDLSPLSHLALELMGEGSLSEGTIEPLTYDPGSEGLEYTGSDLKLGPKEGLALNNGTSFMAAWLGLAVHDAQVVLDHARIALALSLEALFGVSHAFEPQVQRLRKQRAVQEESAKLLALLKGSQAIRWRDGSRTPLALATRPDDPQDDYCLRSATVAHGAAKNAIDHAADIVESELQSVTDNPLVIAEGNTVEVWSGSHFHGAVLALPADYLRSAVSEIASVSERRIAKLVDHKRNYGLPNYLVAPASAKGIESGWMMAQYTAASMVSDLKMRCMPHGVDTIPTGNNAEDYVSMGANASRTTYEAVPIAAGVIGIELLTAARALALRMRQGMPIDAMGKGTRVAYEVLRSEFDVESDGDKPLTALFERVAKMVADKTLLDAVS